MAELTNQQKKDYARMLYLKENLTQQEIAERVGVSRQTLSRWMGAGKWEEMKTGLTLTREQQIGELHRQVAEINRVIREREPGKRFATPSRGGHAGKARRHHQETGNGRGHQRPHQRRDALRGLVTSSRP